MFSRATRNSRSKRCGVENRYCSLPISKGVRFTDEEDGVAKLVIGIAAKGNVEHIQVLTAITNALDSEEAIATLTSTDDIEKVLTLLKA